MPTRAASDSSANLDFLRAYAVLAVYFGHLLETFHFNNLLGPIRIDDIAQTGVVIFFVHTSLVLMLSLERMSLDGRRLFTSFYIRRAFRIYPLSILAVTVMLAASIPAFPTDSYVRPGWGTIASNLALMQNLARKPSVLAPLWSLPCEVQMYIVLPVIYLFLRRYTMRWVPVCLWIANVASLLLIGELRERGIPFAIWYTPCFLGGVVAYAWWGRTERRLRFWGWPIVITVCILLRSATGSSSAWLACLGLGIAAPQFQELGLGRLRRLAAAIAKYSYGIYLSHVVVFWLAFIVLKGKPPGVQAWVCVVLSILLPVVLYHGIERPMIKVGARIASAAVASRAVGSRQTPFSSLRRLLAVGKVPA